MFLENLLTSGAEGLQYTKNFTVSMRHEELGAPSIFYDGDDDGLYLYDHEDWKETEDEMGQRHFQPRVLNTLMRLLINRIPIGQLDTFR